MRRGAVRATGTGFTIVLDGIVDTRVRRAGTRIVRHGGAAAARIAVVQAVQVLPVHVTGAAQAYPARIVEAPVDRVIGPGTGVSVRIVQCVGDTVEKVPVFVDPETQVR